MQTQIRIPSITSTPSHTSIIISSMQNLEVLVAVRHVVAAGVGAIKRAMPDDHSPLRPRRREHMQEYMAWWGCMPWWDHMLWWGYMSWHGECIGVKVRVWVRSFVEVWACVRRTRIAKVKEIFAVSYWLLCKQSQSMHTCWLDINDFNTGSQTPSQSSPTCAAR